MPTRKLSLEQFADLLVDMPDEVRQAVLRGIRSTAARGVDVIRHHIDTAKPYPAVNFGTLRQSVNWAPTVDGATLVVDAPHAVFVDQGTRAHMPPVGPLIVWATRKFGLPPEKAEAVAWAVAKKIAREGVAPRFFMRKAMAQIGRWVINQEITRELEKL